MTIQGEEGRGRQHSNDQRKLRARGGGGVGTYPGPVTIMPYDTPNDLCGDWSVMRRGREMDE